MFDALGIKPAEMTAAQAKAFIKSVEQSANPLIGGYLKSLRAPTASGPSGSKLRGFGPLAIGVGLLPLAFDSNYSWRNYAEDSLCGVMMGCGDAH